MAKEFNLSEKRRKLREYLKKNTNRSFEVGTLLLDEIEKQDEEFIRLLKEQFCKNWQLKGYCCETGSAICDNCIDIDKLAGEDLIDYGKR